MIPHGYRELEVIAYGQAKKVVRAERLVDSARVIIKCLDDHADTLTRDRLRNHIRLASRLNIIGIPAVLDARDSHDGYIVMADAGQETLSMRLRNGPLPLLDALRIACRVSEVLAELHTTKIIHRDVAPQNIIVDVETVDSSLIDLELAIAMSSDGTADADASAVGTLHFMAPEQSGRMHRRVDARSDLYSLGAVLYTMIAGDVPFPFSDVAEILHAHAAKHARRLRTIDSTVPQIVDDVVDTLLRKDPDDRYQRASDLTDDLRSIIDALSSGQPLPRQRHKGGRRRFVIPTVLAGRDQEIQTITNGNTPHSPPRLVVITGPTGIGKSSVVRAAVHRFRSAGLRCGTGAYDRTERDQPAIGVTSAFRDVITQLAEAPPDEISVWKDRLNTELQGVEALVVGGIPEITPYLSHVAPLIDLAPREAQARILHVVERLSIALSPPDKPLILFLEDLQWADSLTFELLGRILETMSSHGTCVVLSIRTDDDEGRTVSTLRELCERTQIQPTYVELAPLTDSAVADILAAATGEDAQQVTSPARLLRRQCGGNPLALRELLRQSAASGHIAYDQDRGTWTYDLDAIAHLVLDERSISLLERHVRDLDDNVRMVLVTATCIGQRCSVDVLAEAMNLDPVNVETLLGILVDEGLLYRVDGVTYHVMHDRVIDSAQSTVSATVKADIHLALMRRLEHVSDDGSNPGLLFELVHHGNEARSRLTSQDDIVALAERNLQAARRARRSTAFSACAHYAEQACRIVGVGHRRASEIVHAATLLLAEAKSFLGGIAEARILLEDALARATTNHTRCDVLEARMTLETTCGSMSEAFIAGNEALRTLNIKIPRRATNANVGLVLLRSQIVLRGRSPSTFLNNEARPDERVARAMRILDGVAASAYYESTLMIAYIMIVRATLAFRYGFDEDGVDAFANYAMILTLMGVKGQGGAFADVALRLAENRASPRTRGVVFFTLAATTIHWTQPAEATLTMTGRAFAALTEVSDGTFAGYAMGHEIQDQLYLGYPIAEIAKKLDDRWKIVRKLFPLEQGPPLVVSLFKTQFDRLTAGLRGQTTASNNLAGDGFDPESFVAELTEAQNAAGLAEFYWKVFFVAVLAGDHDSAQRADTQLSKWMLGTAGQLISIDIALFRVILAIRHQQPPGARIVQRNSRIIIKAAKDSPAFVSRAMFVRGLSELLNKKFDHSRTLLNDALQMARTERNNLLAAVIAEQLYDLHMKEGAQDAALAYRDVAVSAYDAFGASVAADRLRGGTRQESVPVPKDVRHATFISHTTYGTHTTSHSSSVVDLELIMKASASIASEIRLDGLMKTLLTVVLQHAGAERVVLFTRSEGVLRVSADADAEGRMTLLRPSDRDTTVPYVRRAVAESERNIDPIVVGDASLDEPYASDADVLERQVRSIMVLPLKHGGSSLGVLYLENRLAPHVFTESRSGVIRLLVEHVAVAMENARLYDEQQELLTASSRFVPAEFLERLGAASTRDVRAGMAVQLPLTILFADIRRFTTISESLTAGSTFSLLNSYLRTVEPIIRHHDGFVDKYVGDAVLALFPGEPLQAVRAALSMQNALRTLNVSARNDGSPELVVGIGIHHGDVILGTVGTQDRMDTTVIGDTVNVASRLEALTKERGLDIIISHEVVERCPTDSLRTTPLGTETVRGRVRPITVYELHP
ncbi:MAG TPA: hypothetical protein DIS79_10735 [Bacteroidetes bacterium]|nr:hypothetical protein [Bacteroidota bacterium]HRK04029.1 AAA family ATPase [Chlorobiota bacterium]